MLLSGLGVADAELLRLQAEYLEKAAAATSDVQAAFTFLAANNEVCVEREGSEGWRPVQARVSE